MESIFQHHKTFSLCHETFGSIGSSLNPKIKGTPYNSNDIFGPSWSAAFSINSIFIATALFYVRLLNLKVNLLTVCSGVEDQTLTSVLCSSQTKTSEE